jgi:amino acid adenylation domain-containing protein
LEERWNTAGASRPGVNASGFEATYPLTPMQGGMLFHSLYGPESDVYFGQAHWSIRGPLDVPAFHDAWQQVVRRHSILRTSFDWTGPAGPLQRVHHEAVVPLEHLDWRTLSPGEMDERFAQFLSADRTRGFNFTIPPLLRITAIRLGEVEHRIVWSGHHLLVDGRSIHLIVREVMALYTARIESTSIDLPTPVPYSDFVSWLDARDMVATEEFWRRSLREFTAPTSFRTAHVSGREHVRRGATESEEIRLAPNTRDALRGLARFSGVTLNTAIMGAWAFLSSRYSRSDDVVFGVTIGSGGHGAPLSRSLAGLIINTLPLRVQVRSSDSTAALLQQLRAAMLDLKRYAYSSLVDVARWSEVPAGTPLFDHIVVFDNSALDRLAARYGNLELGRLTIEQHSSYPLNLVVPPGRDLVLKLKYARDYMNREAVGRLGGHLEHVLTSMAADPERPLQYLSVMSEQERGRILVDWNATTRERAPGTTLDRLFEQQVRRTPDAVALSGGDEHLTYAQLDRRSSRLAHLLRERGAGPESIVGIALTRSIDLPVGMVAAAKAGAACLLLDPHAPERRIAFMLEDSGASICITSRSLSSRLPDWQRVLYVDGDLPDVESDSPPDVKILGDNLAYVIYTSGTTGEPKGVAIEHRSAVNLVSWHTRTFGVTAADRATQIAGPGFDALVWEIWPNLAAGACICIPPDDVRGVPKQLQEWLLDEKVTVTFVPTPLAEALLALDWPRESTSLRTMLVGGDVLHVRPDGSLPFDLINNYGPSECTVVATSGMVQPGPDDPGCLPPIGNPIDNVEIYLLDQGLRPVPIGMPGELYIGGAGVGRGYLNRPDLTAQAFIGHPFSTDRGARLYKTGDLARYRSDGTIEFVGRLDDQIQLRGFRIELGEIESTLRRHPAIGDAVVAARDDQRGNTTLVAYMVAANGVPLSTPSIRDYLRARLPNYMVPTSFLTIDAIPLSSNDKVDREMLPSPLPVSPEPDITSAIRPSSIEELLISILKTTLRVDAVGIHDSFFDLGGNSLLAIELLERIRLGLGVEIPLSGLFRAPTVEGLAALCGNGSSPATRGALVPIQPLGLRPPFFCAAPVLGTVFPYYELAHAMSDDQPFYGLQPVDFSGSEGSVWTIESIATHYVEAIRQIQRSGPYHLGGWSFGGVVAFEMAQQLQKAGESVGLLAVLDTPAPGLQHYLGTHQSLRVFAQTVLGGGWEYLRDYEYLAVGSRERSAPAYVRGASRGTLRRVFGLGKSFVNRAAIARVVPAESRLLMYHLPTIREMLHLLVKGLVSTLRYRPSIYPGRVTLLRTDEHRAEGSHSALLGWDTVSSRAVQVYPIPGYHLTLLRQPHLPVVAQVLEDVLDAAYRAQQDDLAGRSSPAHAAGQ